MKIAEDFTQQVLLYSKGWYGRNHVKDHIINDLKTLLASYASIEIEYISDRDIWEYLTKAYASCVSDINMPDSLMEMLGKKWYQDSGIAIRKPEEVIIGALSVAKGELADVTQIIKGIRFS